jgi:hypothetical protein
MPAPSEESPVSAGLSANGDPDVAALFERLKE